MQRRWIARSVLVALVLFAGLAFSSPAQAAAAATPSEEPLSHRGWGRGYCGQTGLEATAQALGMTADELSTQLRGGKTLADLAEEKGVELQTVQDAVRQACEQVVRDSIEQAVKDGRISRAMADWLLQGLDNGFWGPRVWGQSEGDRLWRGFGVQGGRGSGRHCRRW